MIYSILNEELQQLSVFKTDIPERLAYVIHKALQKDRAHRYQAVGELIHDLKNIESGTLERGLRSTKKQPSIAVLPFRNLSTDAEQEYFCDGLAEEIINTLTQIENLHVVARTSAFTFKGKQEDIREIGRKLNVESVLEGSVRKSGNRLRITAQLINIADGYHLWSEKYDRVLEDIFAIQDEISLAIVEKLKGKLLREDKSRLERRFTDNEEAYQLYLKGRFHWNKRMVDDIKKAVNYFNQAIEKDSSYALAYVGLAQTYVLFPWFFGSPGKEYYPRAEVAARRALELDENLAEAYSALGLINYNYAWDWLSAEREFKKAIELNPNYPTTYHWYSLMLNSEGRLDEAMNEIKRAQELDPLSLIINVNVGEVLYYMRQYDEAIEQYKKALELDQNFMLAHFGLGNVYCQKGMFADAIAEYQKVRLLVGSSPFGLGWLGYTYARSGKKSDALKVLDELLAFIKQDHVVSYEIGLVYNGLAENNRAIEWIEKAFEERDRFVVDVNVEPALNNLNSEPRFKALLHQMRLEK
jgi:TolB-like protein/Tfp pilus assembly protein PilF